MAANNTLERLRARAREGFTGARNRINDAEIRRLARQGGERSARIARRLASDAGTRVREAGKESPAERAGETAHMGPPIDATLSPAERPQQLHELATARPEMAQQQQRGAQDQSGEDGEEKNRQPDPLVGFGFGPGPANEARVDDLVTGGASNAERRDAADEQGQQPPMFSYGFGGDGDDVDPLLDFGQDDDDGGGLL